MSEATEVKSGGFLKNKALLALVSGFVVLIVVGILTS